MNRRKRSRSRNRIAGRASRWAALPILLAAAVYPGCGGGAEAPEQAGGLDASNTYRNEFFGLALDVPEGWHVASDETRDRLVQAGTDALGGDDETLAAQLEAAEANTHQLVMISEHPVGAAVAFNPNLVLMAEQVGQYPGIDDGGDYLFHIDRTLQQAALPYERIGDTRTHRFGEETWHASRFRVAGGGLNMQQEYMALKRGEYVLVIVTTASDEAGQDALREVAATIRFES